MKFEIGELYYYKAINDVVTIVSNTFVNFGIIANADRSNNILYIPKRSLSKNYCKLKPEYLK